MKVKLFISLLTLLFIFQSCGDKGALNNADEYISLNEYAVDSTHFSVSIYSKNSHDSTILYTDTVKGVLTNSEELETKWFNDSVQCIVPTYVPKAKYKTPTGMTIILTHRQ